MRTVIVSGSKWLREDAARAYQAAREAGCPPGINSAGRTRREQARLYARWVAGLLPGTPSVARPGTSNHEQGTALDLPATPAAWMRAHPEFGFVADRVPGEDWHFEWDPAAVVGPSIKGDTTVIGFYKFGAQHYILHPHGLTAIDDGAQVSVIRSAMGNPVNVDQIAYDALVEVAYKLIIDSAKNLRGQGL